MNGRARSGFFFFAVIAVLILGVILWGIGQYNRIVALDEAVDAQWAQVENQLKRRFDLIPNLVETVKGYAGHEKELLENIAASRTRYFQASSRSEKVKEIGTFESALSRLLLLREAYPELKANESFLKLQDSLEGTENRIAVERKRYNDKVRQLNTYIRTFFGRFVASFAGIKAADYYETPEAQQETPTVNFGTRER